ncbi:DinB family protein [Actinokineospora enzanensis]|uniref:DinB family protein n=1 Tax=Actinokineospora enzanensis TaxID=155975 RepID=UPI0003810B47|nr:DinB family protein [Actinokineospora enzanensis]
MTGSEYKSDLHQYLRAARNAMLWKLDGTSEYDARRPLTPTGTNLLGLVKHLAAVEMGYFGSTFGRPFPDMPVWASDDAGLNDDMWARPDESRTDLVELYRAVWAHADATIEEKSLDSVGRVPWWPEEIAEATLHQLLVHVVAETNRHAGHADIVRELVDGSVGLRLGRDNMPSDKAEWWAEYHEKVDRAAREAAERA